MGKTRENCEEIFRSQLEIQVKTFTKNNNCVHLQKCTMVTKILVSTVINTTIELVILVLDMVCLYDV